VQTPHLAMTTAEYFAYTCGRHVLVITSDVSVYANAMSTTSPVIGVTGYPPHLQSDLAGIFERGGCVKGTAMGSITHLAFVCSSAESVSNMMGRISEGCIIINRAMQQQQLHPPIAILQSISFRQNRAIGYNLTRADHYYVSNQLFVCYDYAVSALGMRATVGEDGLTAESKMHLHFKEQFELRFLKQVIGRLLAVVWCALIGFTFIRTQMGEDQYWSLWELPGNCCEYFHAPC
jgi:V-type H+-transporting ATPase subunit B